MAKYEPKTKKNSGDPYEFLAGVQDKQQRQDSLKLIKMFEDITGQPPAMWGSSIVGFGKYHYKGKSSEGDWMATGFSPRKQNLTLYIMTGFGEYANASGYDPKPLLDKLGKHSTGKSCLYIKKLEDVDNKVLEKLIEESYMRVKSELDNSAGK